MHQIVKPDDIRQLGTILSVWAHPDDESFLAAGILRTAVKNGQQVVCVTATRGEAGSQDEQKWPAANLANIRTNELADALKILGIKQHYWLDYPDGGCCDMPPSQAVNKLVEIIRNLQPDSILTFGPDGITGHDDHRTVSEWVSAAARASKQPLAIYHAVHTPEQYSHHLQQMDKELNIFFNIAEPPLVQPKDCDIHFELTPAICRYKNDALAAQPSQTEVMIKLFGRQFLEDSLATEAFVLAKR